MKKIAFILMTVFALSLMAGSLWHKLLLLLIWELPTIIRLTD